MTSQTRGALPSLNTELDYQATALGLFVAWRTYKWCRAVFKPPLPVSCYRPEPARGWTGFVDKHEALFEEKHQFGENQTAWIKVATEKYGEELGSVVTFTKKKGNNRLIYSHPGDAEYVFSTASNNFRKGKNYNDLRELLGFDGLVGISDPHKHSTQRKMVAPAFNPKTLREIADTILRFETERILEVLRNKTTPHHETDADHHQGNNSHDNDGHNSRKREGVKDVELDMLYDELALNVVTKAAMKQDSLGVDNAGSLFRTLMKDAMSLVALFPLKIRKYLFWWTKRERGLAKLRGLSLQLAKKVRAEHERSSTNSATTPSNDDAGNGDISGKTLIDCLVREEGLSQEALVDQIVTFLFAGHETTSKGLVWTSYLLAQNPEKQALLHEELSSAFPLDHVPRYEDLQSLPYLNQVVKESLRLFPPVGILTRIPEKDDVLPVSKVFVPAGQELTYHFYVTQRSENIYGPDASEFRPERWRKDVDEGDPLDKKIHRCAWMPFLIGPRNCVGKDFAWQELMMVVASVFRTYKISLSSGQPLPPRRRNKITVRPKKTLKFDLEPRVE